MKYIVTAKEMQEYDHNTIDSIGIPASVLMERAALCSRDVILKDTEKLPRDRRKALILAGTGNNGADGLALGRLLCERGFQVSVCIVGDLLKTGELWKQQRTILNSFPVEIRDDFPAAEYTVYIDALFGVGLNREIAGRFREAILWMNERSGRKYALDLPSGLHADNGKILGCAVRADVTITFGFCKRGLVLGEGPELAGKVIPVDIGISEYSFAGKFPGMFTYDEPIRELLPVRNPRGNKGTFGKVLLVAGSKNMAGAAVLAAHAAYRSGAGMVKVISDPENRAILQRSVPEALFGTYEDLKESIEWANVIAVGPGIGRSSEAMMALDILMETSELPMVIDADALNLIAEDKRMLAKIAQSNRTMILTPHVGELSRLMEIPIGELKEDLSGYGMRLAESLGKIVVAKDYRTFICAERLPVCVNLRGNSGMATAGSGDVLVGMIAALLAQGMDGFPAACVGVALHAASGDMVSSQIGEHACMAHDIAEALPLYSE